MECRRQIILRGDLTQLCKIIWSHPGCSRKIIIKHGVVFEMSAIISWFFFATKQNKNLFLICLRSGFCSSPEEEDDSDMLLNALLSVWVFMSQNIFWIVIFSVWLIFHSVWAEKHHHAGLDAEGSRHSLTTVILCTACRWNPQGWCSALPVRSLSAA